jgi:CO/xanthine dehydrogenase Mo-binding subunit
MAERRARGELDGIGFTTFVENTSAGWESGAVRIEADGSVTATPSSTPSPRSACATSTRRCTPKRSGG